MNLNIRVEVKVDANFKGLTDEGTNEKPDPYIAPF